MVCCLVDCSALVWVYVVLFYVVTFAGDLGYVFLVVCCGWVLWFNSVVVYVCKHFTLSVCCGGCLCFGYWGEFAVVWVGLGFI